MKFIWIEILKFFNKNKIKIIGGTLVIMLLFIVSSYLNSSSGNESATEEEQSVTHTAKPETSSDEDSEEIELIEFYPKAEPANFYFFVETVDDTPFTNNLLLEQYITSPRIIREIARETNTNLDKLVEKTGNKAYVNYNDSGEAKIIGVGKNGDTHLMEFYINIGDEDQNLEISNYLYEMITGKEIPLLEDKEIHIFQKPRIKETTKATTFDDSAEGTAVNEFNLVRDGVVGLGLGLIISTGLLLLLSFLSKKLVYAFSYSLNYDDYFFLVDEKLDYQEELSQLLLSPSSADIVLISEDNNFNEEVKVIIKNNDIAAYNNLTEIPNMDDVNRLIYLINENETSRAWYNNQRRLERSYDIPVVVMQFNNY